VQPLKIGAELRAALIRTYAATLKSISKVLHYFSEPAVKRVAKSVFRDPADSDALFAAIMQEQANVERCASLAQGESRCNVLDCHTIRVYCLFRGGLRSTRYLRVAELLAPPILMK
jgi:hypothetical protein